MNKVDTLIHAQFIRFCIVGLSNTILSYFIYSILLLLFRKIFILSLDYLIAQILAFILSVAWSYYWNSKFVFKQKNSVSSLLKTYISYFFSGIFLNTILLYFWVDMLNISEFIGPIFNLIISVPVNFLLNKFWAFKTL